MILFCLPPLVLYLSEWLLHVRRRVAHAFAILPPCSARCAACRQHIWTLNLFDRGQHGFPMLQGDATAALAAIASRNRSHLPDAPLADGYAAAAARRGLADILANGRLRRRMALLLLAWLCLSLVWRAH